MSVSRGPLPTGHFALLTCHLRRPASTATRTRDPRGTTLFRSRPLARALARAFSDTGAWSLYSLGGSPSTVEYHTLLRDILANLCKRIGTDVYCTTADRFTEYLTARSP